MKLNSDKALKILIASILDDDFERVVQNIDVFLNLMGFMMTEKLMFVGVNF
jgi:hypothetical protein